MTDIKQVKRVTDKLIPRHKLTRPIITGRIYYHYNK